MEKNQVQRPFWTEKFSTFIKIFAQWNTHSSELPREELKKNKQKRS